MESLLFSSSYRLVVFLSSFFVSESVSFNYEFWFIKLTFSWSASSNLPFCFSRLCLNSAILSFKREISVSKSSILAFLISSSSPSTAFSSDNSSLSFYTSIIFLLLSSRLFWFSIICFFFSWSWFLRSFYTSLLCSSFFCNWLI